MKTDLASSIVIAIVGVVAAYFVCNLLFVDNMKAANEEGTTVQTVDSSISADLVDPNPEVFNGKALNPTVEVYIGNCKEFVDGECIDEDTNKSQEENTDTGDDSSNPGSTDDSSNPNKEDK